MASTELQQSFLTRINELHKANVAWAEDMRFRWISGVNQARECGAILDEAKSVLNVTEWRNLQSELDFGPKREQVIQQYLKLYRTHPEPIKDIETAQRIIKETLMITGELPFPDGHGPQVLHAPNLFEWMTKSLSSFTCDLKNRIDDDPITAWPQETARQFVAQIEPMIERINTIYAQAKARALLGGPPAV